MTNFHRISRILSLGLALATIVSVAPEADARKQRIRLTTLAPKDSSFDKTLRSMGQQWKQATDGQVDLMIFSGGVQGGETAMIDRMRVNQTQAALISGVGLAEIDNAVAGLQQIPLMFHSYDELDYVMERLGPTLEERIREKGFEVLGWMDSGWVKIFSKYELVTPADMSRGKLYTWAGDTKQTDLLKNMGFRPVPIDATEVSSSLATGLVDVVPLPPFFALATQTYKPAPYMLDIKYTPIVGAIVVSEQAWSKIEPEHQKAMKEIAAKACEEMTRDGREENEQAVKVMSEKFGLQVRAADHAVEDSWQEASEKAYSLIRDNTVPAEIFDEVVRLLKEYRASQ